MNFDIIERTYAGEFARPTTEAQIFKDIHCAVIGTPWGNRDAFKLLAETLSEYFGSAVDNEATSPFAKLSSLSSHSNTLRAATHIANDHIVQRYNKDSYTTGCEALVIAKHNNELSWVQVGQPHLLLVREGRVSILQSALDLSFDYNTKTPLPSRLIGIEHQIEIETRSAILKNTDHLVILARSTVPSDFFSVKMANKNKRQICDQLFEIAAQADHQSPFWIGIL